MGADGSHIEGLGRMCKRSKEVEAFFRTLLSFRSFKTFAHPVSLNSATHTWSQLDTEATEAVATTQQPRQCNKPCDVCVCVCVTTKTFKLQLSQ